MHRLVSGNLREWKDSPSRKPLILRGARQVGKTYSLQEFGRGHFSSAFTFNFETTPDLAQVFKKDLDPNRIIEELGLTVRKKIDPTTDLIIFDEIQACSQALTSLKYFAEICPNQAVCAAGSLLGLQLNPGSFPVGKVDFLDLHPCTFFEFLGALNKSHLQKILSECRPRLEISPIHHEELWHNLKLYFICGGLPEVILKFEGGLKSSLSDAFQQARAIQLALIKSYLADVAKHSGKVNSMHIERVWQSVPRQLSQSHDLSTAKFKFRDVIPGIQGYGRMVGPIDWLMKAGLILRLPIANSAKEPLSAYTKENMFKLLMFDVGILGALSDLDPQTLFNYTFGTYKGYFAENFVCQELTAKNSAKLYAWQEGTSEIEFLMRDKTGVFPIEVKSGNRTKVQSLRVFSQKYKPHRKVIVSGKMPYFDLNTKTEFWPMYGVQNIEQAVNGIDE